MHKLKLLFFFFFITITVNSQEFICNDGIDDDNDGFIDCADGDCAGIPPCSGGGGGPEDCWMIGDEDGDGAADCADGDCIGHPACVESDCIDAIDNDGDGFTDCLDSDCYADIACFEFVCNDGIDDDGDGDIDCDDTDCFSQPACFESDCSDGISNDNDALIDCADIDCGCTLGIELSDFSGSFNKNKVHLKWTTVFEINNDYFKLERSEDGDFFELLGTIDGAGNSTQMQNYMYVDNHPQRLNYYKLTQIDFDGTTTEEKMILVTPGIGNQEKNYAIFPNPAREKVTLQFNNSTPEMIQLKISDAKGIICLQEKFEIKSSVYVIQLDEYQPGIYFLQIIKGTISEVLKLIII